MHSGDAIQCPPVWHGPPVLTSLKPSATLDPTAMTVQQLIDYSGEHLMHELSMLWETAHSLPKHKQGSTEYTALIESFATHLRNLIEFFCFESQAGYVRAREFFDDPSAWPAKTKLTPALRNGLARANKEVAHLTTERKSGNSPDKTWELAASLKQIEVVGKDFAAKASSKKLDDKVREFLELPPHKALVWIGDNVSHSNAASHIVSSPGVGELNASTATQIIIKAIP